MIDGEPAKLSREERKALNWRMRQEARERITARIRTGCPRPDKTAYDKHDKYERTLQMGALGPGMKMYDCRCGYSHNGHPQGE